MVLFYFLFWFYCFVFVLMWFMVFFWFVLVWCFVLFVLVLWFCCGFAFTNKIIVGKNVFFSLIVFHFILSL